VRLKETLHGHLSTAPRPVPRTPSPQNQLWLRRARSARQPECAPKMTPGLCVHERADRLAEGHTQHPAVHRKSLEGTRLGDSRARDCPRPTPAGQLLNRQPGISFPWVKIPSYYRVSSLIRTCSRLSWVRAALVLGA
jgi:hypothetical protein